MAGLQNENSEANTDLFLERSMAVFTVNMLSNLRNDVVYLGRVVKSLRDHVIEAFRFSSFPWDIPSGIASCIAVKQGRSRFLCRDILYDTET